ncbi:Zn-dependent alcohol dehydrogenase [Bacillus sp. AFS055030]|nr:Zn-dependent alcohol dehydrogenase [Bacillus sp. AFS055030]
MKLVDLPNPKAKPGWVVINVEAAGMCHSDVGIVDGTMAYAVDHRPIVLGHEVAGTIAEIGEGVVGFKVGDRVGVALRQGHDEDDVGLGTGTAKGPRGGSAPGLHVDGGYAEQTVVRASRLIPLPDSVPFEMGAIATDAITTAYSAVMTAGKVKADDVVGIIGLGGLGMNGLRTAAFAGATVYGVDVNEGQFQEAIKNGAAGCFKDVSELTAMKPSVIIDFAGFGTTTADAIKAVAKHGRVVQVGLGKIESTISTNVLVTKQIQLVGSSGGTQEDLKRVYDLIVKGVYKPELTEVPFSELDEVLEQFAQGNTRGRIFTRPNK